MNNLLPTISFRFKYGVGFLVLVHTMALSAFAQTFTVRYEQANGIAPVTPNFVTEFGGGNASLINDSDASATSTYVDPAWNNASPSTSMEQFVFTTTVAGVPGGGSDVKNYLTLSVDFDHSTGGLFPFNAGTVRVFIDGVQATGASYPGTDGNKVVNFNLQGLGLLQNIPTGTATQFGIGFLNGRIPPPGISINSVTITANPEPGTLALFGMVIGLAAVGRRARKRLAA